MDIKKLDDNLYYYTNILTEEEQDIVLSFIKKEDGWEKIYDYGHEYDINRDPDADENQSCMIAFRKTVDIKDNKFINIIDKAFKLATDHYREDKNIVGGKNFPPYEQFAHVDKHMPGTTYACHIDHAPLGMESYTVLFYLNDDYEGGELSFSNINNNQQISIRNGILKFGEKTPKSTYPPEHDKNSDVIDIWIKTKPCSIVIFPPLKPYPHTAHEIRSGQKYLIKGFWQVTDDKPAKWSTNPYDGLTEEQIKANQFDGFVEKE